MHFVLNLPGSRKTYMSMVSCYGAFTLDVKSVLKNENLGGILGGT